MLVFLIAGEPSGDALGARLMSALKERTGGAVRFAGIGGRGMAAEGLESLFPMHELSVMGLMEVAPRVPRLLRRIRQTVDAIARLQPAAVVTIDAPDFCFRVASRLRRRERRGLAHVPIVHYVAPQVWAWLPGRARRIARFLDHLLVLLPFEAPFFEQAGVPCTYVGHPVVESGADAGNGAAFRVAHGIAPDVPVVGVLPGSRHSEVKRLLPVYSRALARMSVRIPALQAVAVATREVATEVNEAAAAWPVPAAVVMDDERFDAFAACDVALAASGTVTLELALAGVPLVVGYRMNPLTAWVARRVVTVRYANLMNLVLDREVVPEFLLDACRPGPVAEAALRLLEDDTARAAQRRGTAEALRRLGFEGPSPSRRAADAILGVIGGKAPRTRHDGGSRPTRRAGGS